MSTGLCELLLFACEGVVSTASTVISSHVFCISFAIFISRITGHKGATDLVTFGPKTLFANFCVSLVLILGLNGWYFRKK